MGAAAIQDRQDTCPSQRNSPPTPRGAHPSTQGPGSQQLAGIYSQGQPDTCNTPGPAQRLDLSAQSPASKLADTLLIMVSQYLTLLF